MGTRHITIVKVGGIRKVIQYGQWDGYPTGQGETIADFIQNKMDLKVFKKQVKALKNIGPKTLKKLWTEVGAPTGSDLVTFDISDRFRERHPEFHRDTGSKILDLIHSDKAKKVNLAKDQLGKGWIEYVYELDLDKKTVSVYTDGGIEPAKVIPFAKFTVKSMKKLEQYFYSQYE